MAVTGNDIFVGGGLAGISIPPLNGNIIAIDPVAGTITYVPNPGYQGPDQFDYTLCDTCGCDDATVFLDVQIPPVSGFAYSSSGLTVSFMDASTNPAGWAWDFGDGNTSGLQNPVHTYSTSGTYLVCLTVTNVCGSDTYCDTLTVSCPLPVAVDDYYSICENDTLDALVISNDTFSSASPFFNILTPPVNGIAIPSVIGAIRYIPNPGFNGLDSLQYVLCDMCGCDTAWVYITVDPLPVAGFTYLVSALTVSFTDASLYATSWSWTFGDGNTSNLQNPTHTYALGGTYMVCLVATNNCGSDTFCQQVTVQPCPPPIAKDDSVQVCENGAVTFDVLINDSYTPPPSLTILTPPVNGAVSAIVPVGTLTYAPNPGFNGVDSLQYVLCDMCGCDTAWVYITVDPLPVAGFSSTISGLSVSFTDASLYATSWSWTFGDGNTSTLQNPAHTYGAGGTYTVCQIATNSCGSDTACTTLTVVDPCVDPIAVEDHVYLSCFDTIGNFNVLTNDSYTGTPTVTILSAPLNGSATIVSSTGQGTYTPASGFTGLDSLQYELCDSCGCDTAWVYFHVSGTAGTPGITNDHRIYTLDSLVHTPALDHTFDNGYVYTGWNGNACGWHVPLVKLDPNFLPMWAVEYHLAPLDNAELFAEDVKQTADSGFIICGRIVEYQGPCQTGTVISDLTFLLRLNPAGAPVWFRKYFPGRLNSVVETVDGGFVTVGSVWTGLLVTPPRNARALRVNAAGVPMWSYDIPFNGTESEYNEVITFAPYNYALAGSLSMIACGAPGGPQSDVLFSLVDETPFILGGLPIAAVHNSIGRPAPFSEYGNTITIGAGGFVIGGTTVVQNPITCDTIQNPLLLLEVNPGVVNWAVEHTILDRDVAKDVIMHSSGTELAISGRSASQALLLRTDVLGNPLQAELHNYLSWSTGNSIVENLASRYVTLGNTDGFDPNHRNVYLVEQNPLKDTDCHDMDLPVMPAMPLLPIGQINHMMVNVPNIQEQILTIQIQVVDSMLCPPCPAPVAVDDPYQTCDSLLVDVLANDTYQPGAVVSITSGPSNGTITGFNPATGTFTYIPNPGFSGTDVITYAICDSCGTTFANVLIQVLPDPTASFTYTKSQLTVNFTDASSDATSWNWDFGDGNSSSSQNPTHTYGTSGTYYVCLIASNLCGSDTFCDSVSVVVNCSLDIYESNDTKLTAAKFPGGILGSLGKMYICPQGDVDWFKFENKVGGATLVLVLNNLPANYDLELHNGAGLLTSSNNSGTTSEKIVYSSAPKGWYYVKVFGVAGAWHPFKPYNLKLSAMKKATGSAIKAPVNSQIFRDVQPEASMEVYPNPASSHFNIRLDGIGEGSATLRLLDITGRTVLIREVETMEGINLIRMETGNLSEGTYLLDLSQGEWRKQSKLVIFRE
jgi:PKD repeat protein